MRNISHSLSTHTSTPRKAREFQLKARRIMQRMKKEEILMHNTRAQYDIILQGSRYIGRRRKSGAQEKKAERKREENNTNESSVVDLKAKHRLHVLFFLIYMLCSRIRIQNVFPKFAAGPRLRCMFGGARVCACKLKRNFFSFIRVKKILRMFGSILGEISNKNGKNRSLNLMGFLLHNNSGALFLIAGGA